MSATDTMVTEMKQHYLSCWGDTLNQLNASSDSDEIQSCKEHLSYLVSEDWFTDAITADELATINAALA